MKKHKNFLKVVILFLFLAGIAASIKGQIKEVQNPVPDTPGFDISIFFTGNIQGNIEPCG
jgi:hypothetical protein